MLLFCPAIRAQANLEGSLDVLRTVVANHVDQTTVITFVVVKLRVFPENPKDGIQILGFSRGQKLKIKVQVR